MTPAARLQAAIELLDDIVTSARADGAAADTLIARYFKTRRYAGSKDRAAVRDMIYAVLRSRWVEFSSSARTAVHGFAALEKPEWLALFDDSPHGPARFDASFEVFSGNEEGYAPVPACAPLEAAFPGRADVEYAALLERAHVDLRVDGDRARIQAELAAENIVTQFTPFSPWGLRCIADKVNIEATDAFHRGRLDVQDEGSQIVALLTGAKPEETVIDLCAGAGGKTLALAAMMQARGHLVAHDIHARRLDLMRPRAVRTGVDRFIDQRSDDMADLSGRADCVLIDAPCTGTGTWRRNPEARLRPLAERLPQLQQAQRTLIEQAAGLARPGGRIVYAVCSVLAEEGEDHLAALPKGVVVTDWRTGWPQGQVPPQTSALRPDCLKLTPYAHGCDGFFIVCLQKL